MRPLGKNLQHGREFGFLGRAGLLQTSILLISFGGCITLAFLAEDSDFELVRLAGPLAMGLAVLVALRAQLKGAVAVGVLSLLLLLATRGLSDQLWDWNRVGHGFGLCLMGTFFSGLTAVTVGYFRRISDLYEQDRNMLHKIFDALPIGVWVRARDGRTIFVNDRWAAFGNQDAATMIDQQLPAPGIDLGPNWKSDFEDILERNDSAIRYRSLEITDPRGTRCSMTLLSLGLFIDPLEDMGTLSLLIDETALRRYEDKARRSEHGLRLALDSARMGFWNKDLETGEASGDANWYSLIGLPRDCANDPSKEWKERLHPDDKGRVNEAYRSLLLDGTGTLRIDYRLRSESEGYIWVQDCVTIAEVGGSGRPKRLMGTLQDVSERKKTEEALELARDRAESANDAKSQFIATVSHEIRTPLNAIIGMSSFLIEGEEDPEKKDIGETIYNSGKSLLFLVNDLLDFSKIEAGRLELEVQEFPLRLLLEDCVKLFRLRAEEKNIRLELDLSEALPEFAFGDMERLRQILQNLLSNALKFTDAGHVRISAELVHRDTFSPEQLGDKLDESSYLDDTDYEYLKVIVSDTGIGIPKSRQHVLFKAFSQVDASATRKYGGTGLGLVICKRLVHAMGGSIWLESEEGEGAAFGFVVRLLKASPRGLAKQSGDYSKPLAAEFPCDILLVGESAPLASIVESCRAIGYTPHRSEDYLLSHPSYGRRRYNLIFIRIEDVAKARDLIKRIDSHAYFHKPDAIVGVSADPSKISEEHRRFIGVSVLIEENASPETLRDLICRTVRRGI